MAALLVPGPSQRRLGPLVLPIRLPADGCSAGTRCKVWVHAGGPTNSVACSRRSPRCAVLRAPIWTPCCPHASSVARCPKNLGPLWSSSTAVRTAAITTSPRCDGLISACMLHGQPALLLLRPCRRRRRCCCCSGASGWQCLPAKQQVAVLLHCRVRTATSAEGCQKR